MVIATLNPLFTSPSTLALGTRTLSKSTVVVELARRPILSSWGPMLTPGMSRVTMNAEMMRLASGVARACEHREEVGHPAVGDPELVTIEHPVVAVGLGATLDRRGIGAGARLRERKRRDHLAGR